MRFFYDQTHPKGRTGKWMGMRSLHCATSAETFRPTRRLQLNTNRIGCLSDGKTEQGMTTNHTSLGTHQQMQVDWHAQLELHCRHRHFQTFKAPER